MTFKRIVNWTAGLPVAAAVIVFAVANRQWITVSFDPFNRDQPYAFVTMPLWVLFFCGIFAGMLAGWIAAWLAQGKWRKAAKNARIELLRAHNEHERLKRDYAARASDPTRDSSL